MATIVRSKGYPTLVLDLSSYTEPDLARQVPDGYDLYGFSTYSVNYGITRDLAAHVRRRNPAALFVAGGPHASALPPRGAADGFDVVVTGEGEVAVLQLLGHLVTGEQPPSIMVGVPPEPLDSLS